MRPADLGEERRETVVLFTFTVLAPLEVKDPSSKLPVFLS